jgi:hypothetical protein
VLLLKCYDSRADGRARFTPHTGFKNPACPPDFVPRESIEVRTLLVFDEAGLIGAARASASLRPWV